MKKIVFFDIDGTLYDNVNKCVHPSTLNALKQLSVNEDIKVAVATGRAPFMMYSIESIKEYIDYYVCINGQYIISKEKEVLYDGPITQDEMERLIASFNKHKAEYGFEGNSSQAVARVDELVRYCFNGLNLNIPNEDPEYYKTNNVYQMWTFVDDDRINSIKLENPNFQFINWMKYGYDVLPKITSKGEGLKRLIEILKIDGNNVYAFGDANNDIEMLQMAKYSVAMGNGFENVKKVASYTTDRIENDGIYNALKKFNLIK